MQPAAQLPFSEQPSRAGVATTQYSASSTSTEYLGGTRKDFRDLIIRAQCYFSCVRVIAFPGPFLSTSNIKLRRVTGPSC
jgi:hypothetical protein